MNNWLEKKSTNMTNWIGTPGSLVIHTFLFIAAFSLQLLDIPFDSILLILTTIVSLEAIYLAIFIQMTVNRQAKQIEEVGEDIEGIQEEVKDLGEDIDKIQEEDEDATGDERVQKTLATIEGSLKKIAEEMEVIKTRVGNRTDDLFKQ
ncbi:MAG: hypothetical protein A3D47_02345 [Candidatus Colwellbacteria bacterium RIFCSPHIGHO2_02_FULL_43_15]|uniref:DUF1003 domain-containing protein n=1 Tax=Candidatus Colwellbacteria bacterium RIFCSPHIGHO2_02_FULL_43_15 TaxID=1797686 RepID=A0A1G1YYX0_9BACT|nr:MAG: hypothetical protein A3D47_02345 [Candidatus Colwellbacteria bacterium RIFCSPHIGHO2_02_FULL_43_15]